MQFFCRGDLEPAQSKRDEKKASPLSLSLQGVELFLVALGRCAGDWRAGGRTGGADGGAAPGTLSKRPQCGGAACVLKMLKLISCVSPGFVVVQAARRGSQHLLIWAGCPRPYARPLSSVSYLDEAVWIKLFSSQTSGQGAVWAERFLRITFCHAQG